MKAADTVAERMARAWWNAYRDGFLAVGGDRSYPTWDEFSEARAKAETVRCMRHAAEVLREFIPDFDTLFDGKPMRRKKAEKLQAELQAEALNMGRPQ